MKRSALNIDNDNSKKSRPASESVTITGTFCVDEVGGHSNENRLEEDDLHPNVLLERLLTTKLEQMVEKVCAQSRPIRNVSGEKIIPTFDPDNHEMNVKNWMAKIYQLGLVHTLFKNSHNANSLSWPGTTVV